MRTLLDVSEEFYMLRLNNGIKLIRPENIKKYLIDDTHIISTVKNIFDLSFHTYFFKSASIFGDINEANANSLGCSRDYLVGKSVQDVGKKEDAEAVFKNNLNVINSYSTKVFEENIFIKEEVFLSTLSIKVPCTNESGNSLGLFGLSIFLGKHSLADSLEQIIKLGFLNQENISKIRGQYLGNVHITQQESKIIKLLIRGMTAKRISVALNISRRTVEHHLMNIKIKLDVKSKSELIEKIISLNDSL